MAARASWPARSADQQDAVALARRQRPGFREIDWDFLVDVYAEQIAALVEGGADFILIETVFDTLNAKAGVMAVRKVEAALGREIPIMLSMTLTDLSGRNLSATRWRRSGTRCAMPGRSRSASTARSAPPSCART
jgi:methionine synthase I (cobalamin-dependent)